MSAWILVVVSGVIEAGWAIGLKASQGFTRPLISALTVAGMIVSMVMLAIAARTLPIGTAYAVWVGIGAVGAVILGVVFFGESMSPLRVVSLVLVLGGIVGLKLSTPPAPPAAATPADK
jgi:quaternary ammonium compound-resistance protein SugE